VGHLQSANAHSCDPCTSREQLQPRGAGQKTGAAHPRCPTATVGQAPVPETVLMNCPVAPCIAALDGGHVLAIGPPGAGRVVETLAEGIPQLADTKDQDALAEVEFAGPEPGPPPGLGLKPLSHRCYFNKLIKVHTWFFDLGAWTATAPLRRVESSLPLSVRFVFVFPALLLHQHPHSPLPLSCGRVFELRWVSGKPQ
jgi:hypothetical protein